MYVLCIKKKRERERECVCVCVFLNAYYATAVPSLFYISQLIEF